MFGLELGHLGDGCQQGLGNLTPPPMCMCYIYPYIHISLAIYIHLSIYPWLYIPISMGTEVLGTALLTPVIPACWGMIFGRCEADVTELWDVS